MSKKQPAYGRHRKAEASEAVKSDDILNGMTGITYLNEDALTAIINHSLHDEKPYGDRRVAAMNQAVIDNAVSELFFDSV